MNTLLLVFIVQPSETIHSLLDVTVLDNTVIHNPGASAAAPPHQETTAARVEQFVSSCARCHGEGNWVPESELKNLELSLQVSGIIFF